MDTIEQSMHRFLDEMHRVGYSVNSMNIATGTLTRLCEFHSEAHCQQLDRQLSEKYIEGISKKLNNDAIGQKFAKKNIWYVRKFLDFCETGIINAEMYTLPKIPVPDVFSKVIDTYIDEVATTPKQKKSRAWAPRRYAFWLNNHAVASFCDVKVTDLRQYIIDDTANLKSTTIPSLRSEMRKFHKWLFDNGYIESTYEIFFDFQTAVENKLHPASPPDDVAKVISQIDRTTAMGKRDYAAIMLGIVFGLRPCDIKNLKLTDINWRIGEICISQSKTGNPLALPLTTDVGKALKDYILNGRPDFDDPHVFLRHLAPIGPIKSSSAFGKAYTHYMKLAGVKGEGGFYQLRRSEGKNLVVSGTPVTTVAQILGHTNIGNTKQYIALDTAFLKVCALSLDGIEPRRWKS